MGERALGWILRIMGLLLWIVPIIAAFAVHGFDPMATVMPKTDQLESLLSTEGLENMVDIGDVQISGDLSSIDPTAHYVSSWEQAESKLVTDLGSVLGYVDLGNAGAHEGHAPTRDIFGDIGCAGCLTPDGDNADPTKDCVSPSDGNAPVFDLSASPGSFSAPLPMTIPAIVGRDDPTNAVVVRSSINQIETAFTNAGWEFYSPCEGYTSVEPHTPIGEVADAFLDDGSSQYHVRIFYGGHDSTYGEWYYIGAHYEGQNAVPSIGAPITFTNPFSFPITVDNTVAEIYCSNDNYHLGQGRIRQQTVVQAGQQGSINIVMGFTYDGFNHLIANHLVGTSINTSMDIEGTLRVKIYEISITMTLEQTFPFPSIPVVT